MNESDENEDENPSPPPPPKPELPPKPTESPPDTIPPDTIPETREGRRRSSQKFRALFGESICKCPDDCELHPPPE